MFNLILCLLVTIFGLTYYLVRKKFNYWADRGVHFVKPSFPFGNLEGLGYTWTLAEQVHECYMELRNKGVLGGLYFFLCPMALITDLDLLRDVLVKDFKHFHSRGEYINEKVDPLSVGLFTLEGETWKDLRSHISPIFTSSKIKTMHSTLLSVVDLFREYLVEDAEKRKEVNIQELFAQFTTDAIGNVILGINCQSINSPDNPFRRMSRRNNQNSALELLKVQLISTYPKIGKFMKARFTAKETAEFFNSTVRGIVDNRRKNSIPKNDLVQLLIPALNRGHVSMTQFTSAAVEFFSAGFGNTATTLTFAAYQLALNQEVQEKVREEIRAVLKKHNGVLSYEATMELPYVDQVIKETLRLYPPVLRLRRQVNQTFKVPGTETVLEKGVRIFVPVWSIHRDPDFWPNPDLFDPDRFTEENISKRHPFAYLPFGHGPRTCIGMRLGLMMVKVGLVTVLQNLRLSPAEKTPIPVKLDPKTFTLGPQNGMILRVDKV